MKTKIHLLLMTGCFFLTHAFAITVSVGVVPSGDPLFSVDGFSYNFGQNYNWTSGSTHYLSAWDQNSGQNPQTEHYVFNYWLQNGFTHINTANYTISPTSNSSYIAYYTHQYRIFINSNPSSGGTTTPSTDIWVNNGSNLLITATPNCGYYFDHWLIDGSTVTQNPYTVSSINSSKDIYAIFVANPVQSWNWTQIPSLQSNRSYSQTNSLNGEMYCIGGYNGGFLNSCEKFNGVSWTTLSNNMSQSRAQFVSCVLNNSLFVFGGLSTNSIVLNSSEIFNGVTWSPAPNMQIPLHDMNGEVYDDNLYLFGGITSINSGNTYTYDDKIRKFSPVTGWTQIGTLPFSNRSGYSTAMLNGKIYVIGGAYAASATASVAYYKEVFCYDPSTSLWNTSPLPSMCYGRVDFSAKAIDGKIYVVGGVNDSQNPISVMEVFDPSLNYWTSVDDIVDLTCAYTSSIVHNDILYILGVNGNQCWNKSKTLTLNANLEGLFNTSTNNMREASDGAIPKWGVGIADKISVELHDAINYNNVVFSDTKATLTTAGNCIVYVPTSLNGSYYITIKNRNSVETTTASPVSFAGVPIGYAFDIPAKVLGGNLMQITSGHYVIYCGDVNQDGIIDSGDMIPVDNACSIFSTGYLPTDINGDGLIDSDDMMIVNDNASAFVSSVIP
jgi:N-acetylneuraminic acid mutarotase